MIPTEPVDSVAFMTEQLRSLLIQYLNSNPQNRYYISTKEAPRIDQVQLYTGSVFVTVSKSAAEDSESGLERVINLKAEHWNKKIDERGSNETVLVYIKIELLSEGEDYKDFRIYANFYL